MKKIIFYDGKEVEYVYCSDRFHYLSINKYISSKNLLAYYYNGAISYYDFVEKKYYIRSYDVDYNHVIFLVECPEWTNKIKYIIKSTCRLEKID